VKYINVTFLVTLNVTLWSHSVHRHWSMLFAASSRTVVLRDATETYPDRHSLHFASVSV